MSAVLTIADLLHASAALEGVSDSPRLDVEVLLCHVLNQPRSYLYAWPERTVDNGQQARFQILLRRRAQGEPVAYLTGVKEFWSLPLQVNASTLIPRPETELLVQVTLDLTLRDTAAVLDLGTGCGAIALALAHERPYWRVTGVDKVEDAVKLAQQNRRHLGLDNAVFFASNWFANIPAQLFDVVVSNPPYISATDSHLHEGDVRFEPESALVADDNGCAAIRHIVDTATNWLATGGWLLIEHGFDQGPTVRERLRGRGYQQIATVTDLAGVERVTRGCLGTDTTTPAVSG